MAEPDATPPKQQSDDDAQSPLAEMLEAPPSVIARGAIYLMVAVVAGGLAWAGFGEIDEVVTATASVAHVGRGAIVASPVRGALDQILVEEGSAVEPGQKLAALWSPEAAQLRAALRKQESLLARARGDRNSVVAARLGRLRQEIAEREAALAAVKDASAAKIARLRAGNRAPAEVEDAEREARVEWARYESSVADARRRAAEAEDAAETSVRALERELEDAKGALAELLGVAEIDPDNDGRIVVTSRARGIVGPLAVRQSGAPVERGQPILTLLPSGTAMAAHIALSQADLMKVRPGQTVRLKLQSFPFQEFGGLTGKVKDISRVAARADQGPATFSVTATLERDYFNRGGRRIGVAPGSAGVAEIVVGRSSLLSRTLATFRDLGGRE